MSTTVPLSSLCSLINGRAFKQSEWGEDGLPIIRIQNLNDETKGFNYYSGPYERKHEVNPGDLLFSWSGTPGSSFGAFFWRRTRGLLNQHIFNVVADESKVCKPYLRYALNYLLDEIIDCAHGAVGLQHITKSQLHDIPIPLPALPEQRRIAAILDAADALRAKRRASIEQLDLLMQSTFLEMFGDPATNPKGWPVGVVGDLLAAVNYGTSKKPHDNDGNFPVLRMNNITYQGGWDFSSLKYVDLTPAEESKYLVHKGELLFNRTNSKELVGKTAVYRREEPVAFAGYLVRAVVNESADGEYVAAFMNTARTKAYLRIRCKNIIGMANINAKEFQAIPVPKPPVALQRQFACIVASIERQRDQLLAQLPELDTLFASLQSRAFSGELRSSTVLRRHASA